MTRRSEVEQLNRIQGALVGTLVGDALGRPFEGTPRSDLGRLTAAVERRKRAPIAWGHSDDGEMMLAVADSISRLGTVDEGDILDTLSAQHEPARGYGKGTRAAFRVWRDTGSWRLSSRALWEEGSRGNGGAVRVAPVAILYRRASVDVLIGEARRSALPTHAHSEALEGAVIIALAIRFALRGRAPAEIPELLKQHAGTSNNETIFDAIARTTSTSEAVKELGNGVLARESVPLALWAHYHTCSFDAAVTRAICAGGDTDSIGAMTGGIAGATYGAAAIPSTWVSALEQDSLERAMNLAQQLYLLGQ